MKITKSGHTIGSNPAKHKKSLSTKSRNLENVIKAAAAEDDGEAEEKYDKAIVKKVRPDIFPL